MDPFTTEPQRVKATSAALARNHRGLDNEVDAIIADLWDGVSSGQARSMNDHRKDALMEDILSRPGFGPLSPQRQQFASQGPPSGAMAMLGPPSPGPGLAMHMPSQQPPQAIPQQQQLEVYPPPAGAQDYETRRQLEMMRADILRLEEQVLQAVEAEEGDLPPPPPLIQKNPSGIQAFNKAVAYEEIVDRIQRSVVGAEPDVGGTPCNSVDDPNVPMMMPPKGGMKIRQQIEALQKECQELREATVQEVGGEAAARRMREMQQSVKATRANRFK
jgi:hypothetical protein